MDIAPSTIRQGRHKAVFLSDSVAEASSS